jgi:hypothetical protein
MQRTSRNKALTLGGTAVVVLATGGYLAPAAAAAPQSVATIAAQPRQLQIGDFNGDGKADFALFLDRTSQISVWFGDGSGGYVEKTRMRIGAPGAYTTLAFVATDLNGDGKTDLAVLRDDKQPAVEGYLSDGSGKFTLAKTTTYKTAGAPADNTLQAADLNGDGKMDVVTYSDAYAEINGTQHPAAVHVFFGDGNGGFQAAVDSQVCPDGYTCYGFGLGDFNGDGKADLVLNARSTSAPLTEPAQLAIMLSDGSGGFTPGGSYTGTDPYFGQLMVSDINGDHVADVVAVLPDSGDSGRVVSVLGNGSGGFGTSTVTATGPNMDGSSICQGKYGTSLTKALGDFNGDGHADLFSGSIVSGSPAQTTRQIGFFAPQMQLRYRPGDGSGGFGAPVTLGTVGGSGLADVATADLTGGGRDSALVVVPYRYVFGWPVLEVSCDAKVNEFFGVGKASVWEVDGG